MRNPFPIVVAFALVLSACTLVEVEYDTPPPGDVPEAPKDVEPVRETKNVTYEGTVQPAGISIYQQGSHRLVLPGGKFILLESDDHDLNGYVGEDVKITGALRPTVEAGGMIMRVEKIELMLEEEEEQPEEETEEVEEELPTAEDLEAEEPAEEEPVEEPGEEQSADAEEEPQELPEEEAEPEEEVKEEPVEEEVSEEAEAPTEPDTAFVERTEAMARQDFEASNWTQQYCTSHIGFCAPVHRNWWFKSFGATNSTLWHVELSSEPVESLGQGPIAIDLLAGSIGEQSGTVDTADGKATGYVEWTFGRHFRISGDESLKGAIEYITGNISDYAQ